MDIAVTWDPIRVRATWIISKGGFLLTTGLSTAIMASLFTNKRAPADWNPPAGSPPGRGGFWGDTYRPRPMGSLLWLLYRSSIGDRQAVQNNAKFYCEDALAWLEEDGLVQSIDVQTGWPQPEALGIKIGIMPLRGPAVVYSFLWPMFGGPSAPIFQGVSVEPGPPIGPRPALNFSVGGNSFMIL
jgi:phage gp46-like protein